MDQASEERAATYVHHRHHLDREVFAQRRWRVKSRYMSFDDLTTALEDRIELWDVTTRPFKWTKTADQIIDRICRCCSRISRPGHQRDRDTAGLNFPDVGVCGMRVSAGLRLDAPPAWEAGGTVVPGYLAEASFPHMRDFP